MTEARNASRPARQERETDMTGLIGRFLGQARGARNEHHEFVSVQTQLAGIQEQLVTLELHLNSLRDQINFMQERLDRVPEYCFMATEDVPIPPPDLRCLVQDTTNLGEFFTAGSTCASLIVESLYNRGVMLGDFQTILDFGCGCGRIIRHFRSLKNTKLYGTDYNPRPITWCRSNLSFAEFGVNGLEPPLEYPDKSFDLVYAFSVLTQLPEPLIISWMNELSRVLRPGGYLVLSTLDENHLDGLPEAVEQVAAGKVFVVHEDEPGSNNCCAYFSTAYLREQLARAFEFLEHMPWAASGQTFYLLRKHLLPSAESICARVVG